MSCPSSFIKRTNNCGELRPEHIGQQIALNGWVHRRRDHGGLIFVDLRDRSGLVQVVFDPEVANEAWQMAHEVRSEYVLAVRGEVRRRPEGTANPNLATGEVEVVTHEAQVLNPAETPPISVAEAGEVDDMVRMKYRYIDLRTERMQRNLQLRHQAAQAVRNFLSGEGFWEVETPVLFRPTPEGARDYLVPSRVSPGNFYALPQSPQIMKQLLMVAGVEKYFQLARCYRDEDLRADRQPEHTQIDIEMSFIDREDIYDLTERLFHAMFKETISAELPIPFPRMTYAQAIARYGTDKPDLRFGMEFVDLTDIARDAEFKVFSGAVAKGGQVKGICVKGCGEYPRAQLDNLTEFAQQHKAQGLAWLRVIADGVDSPIAKFFTDEETSAIVEAFGAAPGDLLLMVADEPAIVAEALDWVRREMARRENLIPENVFAPLWVSDFPLFVWDPENNRWGAEHHPFCMPHPEDFEYLESDPGKVRALAYDVVINGVEMASGSIRIHRRDIQQQVFNAMGIDEQKAEERFGFMLKAFEYGTPPHGGIAPGFDRLVMMMAGEDNIREVIAFPKTQKAQCLMSGAPAPVDPDALRELHVRLNLPPQD